MTIINKITDLLMCKKILLSFTLGAIFPDITHANVNSENIIEVGESCDTQSIVDAIRCGQATGKFHTLYYSTHNASHKQLLRSSALPEYKEHKVPKLNKDLLPYIQSYVR